MNMSSPVQHLGHYWVLFSFFDHYIQSSASFLIYLEKYQWCDPPGSFKVMVHHCASTAAKECPFGWGWRLLSGAFPIPIRFRTLRPHGVLPQTHHTTLSTTPHNTVVFAAVDTPHRMVDVCGRGSWVSHATGWLPPYHSMSYRASFLVSGTAAMLCINKTIRLNRTLATVYGPVSKLNYYCVHLFYWCGL